MNAAEAYDKALAAGKRLPELESFIIETEHLRHSYWAYHYAKNILKWKIKGNKDFYISAIKTWDDFPKHIKNCPDIMTAYFKEEVLK